MIRRNSATAALAAAQLAAPVLRQLGRQKRLEFLASSPEEQLLLLRRYAVVSPPLRMALANDKIAERIRARAVDLFESNEFEAAAGAAFEMGAAAASRSRVAKMNPFIVAPSRDGSMGASYEVSHQELESIARGSALPTRLRRDMETRQFESNQLPAGYSIEADRTGKYHILYMGEPTGKYALHEGKAKEIISRMESGRVTRPRMRRNP